MIAEQLPLAVMRLSGQITSALFFNVFSTAKIFVAFDPLAPAKRKDERKCLMF
jgi:hypothetical protein